MNIKQLIWDYIFKNDKQFVLSQIDLDEQMELLQEDNKTLLETNQYLTLENNKLKEELNKTRLPKEYVDLVDFYKYKYPRSDVNYSGFWINRFGKEHKLSIKVNDYIQVTKSMKEWIKQNNLEFNKEITIKNVSEHIYKVYSKFVRTTNYQRDINQYGKAEMWQFPSITFYMRNDKGKIQDDCEGLAVMCASLIKASGVPDGLYRVVAGTTANGFGHASLWYYNHNLGYWCQLETTATSPRMLRSEKDNGIYIIDVWFSFDANHCWSKQPKWDLKFKPSDS